MSLALLLLCRRSINSSIRGSLLRPVHCSSTLLIAESSTMKSKYGSLKPSSPVQNPFREPTDEKSRRLKLQENIRFREKFQLEQDYELIYAMPRQRMYSLMHLICTCAGVSMLAFVVVHFHREMLDMEPLVANINQDIPPWVLYSVATMIGSAFTLVLFFIARMPVRLYYSPVRKSYALFYHPVIGVLRKKKVVFRVDQYKLIPQKLDSIDTPQRAIKIGLQFGDGLLNIKKNFYFVEEYFRSRRDIHRIRTKDIKVDEIINKEKEKEQEQRQTEEENIIWETVVEKKGQFGDKQKPTQRRTFM